MTGDCSWEGGDAWIENQEVPQFPAAETKAHFVKHQSSASRFVAVTTLALTFLEKKNPKQKDLFRLKIKFSSAQNKIHIA